MIHQKKVAFITGANKGLGLEIARQLGQHDITVVISSRDKARGQAALEALTGEQIDAHLILLDVNDSEAISNLPSYFDSTFGRLDILVNNAGVLFEHSEEVNRDTFRKTFETNLFSVWELTEALLPLLLKSDAGRIVNHSSILGSITVNRSQNLGEFAIPAYNSSKAALNMLTAIWAKKYEKTSLKVNSAHPGWVKTDLGGPGAQLEVTEGAQTAVRLALLEADGPTGSYFHNDEVLPW
ncbi:MAG: SDR family oxidoreductase [Fimbriimonadaceae bacterium]|jgi:NAD(P)-dependent dehydrogenase (short-subunit alcohol dehydrogenase family)|nr:SDR family oxidoreductase [Fimbriimonadaceae bacterium]